MESLLNKAIQAVESSEIAYCKFLAANDTKATKSHQSGYHVSKTAWKMFLANEPKTGQNIKVDVTIKWQDDFETDSVFTYYGAKKNEFRLTNFGKKFPYREDENVGDLFVLAKMGENYFKAFVLSHDEEIEDFFSELNISATETNGIIPKQFQQTTQDKLSQCFLLYLKSLEVDFPTTLEIAKKARDCYNESFAITEQIVTSNPDKEILNWVDAEFQLFKTIEMDRYSKRIETPFKSVEELVEMANSILNRRKSRAGKSLEHHLAEIFELFRLKYNAQALTEDNKKADFLFPNSDAYQNPKFDNKRLIVLASKTTCKDRWRQILNEADKIKIKHLFTLQQGISKNQLKEMYKYNVCLVVPRLYVSSFPDEFRSKILTLETFVKYVQSTQT